MEIKVQPWSVVEGSGLEIWLRPTPDPIPTTVSYNIARVDDEYTEFALSSSGPVEIEGDWLRIDAKKIDGLKPGLFQLVALDLKQDPNEKGDQLGTEEFGRTVVFEVRERERHPRTEPELREAYRNCLSRQAEAFREGLGEGARTFLVLVFVKDLLVTRRMRLGAFEAIPFEGLSCVDELTAMSRFLEQAELGSITSTKEADRAARKGQPSFVLHFPVVKANTPEQATSIAQERADYAISVLSLQRGGAGERFGTVVLEPDRAGMFYRIETPTYQGNLIGGFLSGEQPRITKNRIERLVHSERARLYTALYREALREPHRTFQYFRFWSLLETIARGKEFVGEPKRDWKGKKITNRRGEFQKIQDHAQALVFELLRTSLTPGFSESSFASNKQQGTISEQIPIWYQRRNCVVHGGECLCRGDNPKTRKQRLLVCKRAHDEMAGSGVDPYLLSLQSICELVVARELMSNREDGA